MIYGKRAAAGAALLDTYAPGWERQVSLDDLNMDEPDLCILGQLYGDYFEGVFRLRLFGGMAEAYGFILPIEVPALYWLLERAWSRQIRVRRVLYRKVVVLAA